MRRKVLIALSVVTLIISVFCISVFAADVTTEISGSETYETSLPVSVSGNYPIMYSIDGGQTTTTMSSPLNITKTMIENGYDGIIIYADNKVRTVTTREITANLDNYAPGRNVMTYCSVNLEVTGRGGTDGSNAIQYYNGSEWVNVSIGDTIPAGSYILFSDIYGISGTAVQPPPSPIEGIIDSSKAFYGESLSFGSVFIGFILGNQLILIPLILMILIAFIGFVSVIIKRKG